jgi:hypothetical protein
MGKDGLPDDAHLPKLLDDFHAREILHVTFGSVLTERDADGRLRLYDRMVSILRTNSETYTENLKSHFVRHLSLFVL